MAASKKTVTFTKVKETKGTWAYMEDNTVDPAVGALYVKKATVAELGNPTTLKVTIEAGA